jgi:6-phosphofructokinase 1
MRETTLGHLQRGGVPIAYDRVLASQFGVKAFEMVLNQEYGHMVAYRHPNVISVPLKDAVAKMNFVNLDCDLVKTAQGLGISLGI